MSYTWLHEMRTEIDHGVLHQLPKELVLLISEYLRGMSLEFNPRRLFSGGLFEYCGTAGWQLPWHNPAEEVYEYVSPRAQSIPVAPPASSDRPKPKRPDRIRMICSASGFVHGSPEEVVGVHSENIAHRRGWNEMKAVSHNYFGVDLGSDRRFTPTHYTLMNDSQDGYSWWSWDLQASNDGVQWFIIDRRIQWLLGQTDPQNSDPDTVRVINSSALPITAVTETSRGGGGGSGGGGEMREGFVLDRVPQRTLLPRLAAVRAAELAAKQAADLTSTTVIDLKADADSVTGGISEKVCVLPASPIRSLSDLMNSSAAAESESGGGGEAAGDAVHLDEVFFQSVDRPLSDGLESFPAEVVGPISVTAGTPASIVNAFRFRYFRVFQHRNSFSSARFYLKCNGFELHGTLWDAKHPPLA